EVFQLTAGDTLADVELAHLDASSYEMSRSVARAQNAAAVGRLAPVQLLLHAAIDLREVHEGDLATLGIHVSLQPKRAERRLKYRRSRTDLLRVRGDADLLLVELIQVHHLARATNHRPDRAGIHLLSLLVHGRLELAEQLRRQIA